MFNDSTRKLNEDIIGQVSVYWKIKVQIVGSVIVNQQFSGGEILQNGVWGKDLNDTVCDYLASQTSP